MIIDIPKFIARERPYWDELEQMLSRLDSKKTDMSLEDVQRLHYLYDRAASSLSRMAQFTSERRTFRYLEVLVARAYGEVHSSNQRVGRLRPLYWFLNTFPQTFRRWSRAFQLSCLITLVGCVFGGFAIGNDNDAKRVLLPFGHGDKSPSERVAEEEAVNYDHMDGVKGQFSASLMTHNTKVSILTMASGILYGIGTVVLLFYNGIIMGGITVDYIRDGQLEFLLAWLLPHGSIEIPAILIAGQAGLVLGMAVIGWNSREPMALRLRRVSGDLATLIGGVAVMMVWAGIIESFMSQYHEPVLPYWVKITFGVLEVIGLVLLLNVCGRKTERRVAA